MAALLTSEMNSIDGVVKFIAECRSHDIPVLPPNILESEKAFTVSDANIQFGLLAVKNVGEGAIDAILEARSHARISSLFDFCEHVDLKRVNKRVVESLIKCGAFDFTGARRAQMMAALEEALEYGQRMQKERNDPQLGLFNTGSGRTLQINTPVLADMPEWDDKQRLNFEKESLGFFISGHPLNRYEALINTYTNADSIRIREMADGSAVRIGGMVAASKSFQTKRGESMAFVTLEDMHGTVEAVVFASIYPQVRDLLNIDNPILVQGRLQKDEKAVKILAEQVIPLDKAEEVCTASIHFNLEVSRTDKEQLVELQRIFDRFPGSSRAFLHLRIPPKTETVIELGDHIKLQAGAALTREVNGLLGYPAVETVSNAISVARRSNGAKWKKQR
jgi:DNA polymerase-3 subunit alpha